MTNDPGAMRERQAFIEEHKAAFIVAYDGGRRLGWGEDTIVLAFDLQDAWARGQADAWVVHATDLPSRVDGEDRSGAIIDGVQFVPVEGEAAHMVAAFAQLPLEQDARAQCLDPPPGMFRILTFSAGGIAFVLCEKPPRTAFEH